MPSEDPSAFLLTQLPVSRSLPPHIYPPPQLPVSLSLSPHIYPPHQLPISFSLSHPIYIYYGSWPACRPCWSRRGKPASRRNREVWREVAGGRSKPPRLEAVFALLGLPGVLFGALVLSVLLSPRSLEAPRPRFGAFGVNFWSLFWVPRSWVRFCIDFGSKNEAKIDDFGGVSCA